MLLRKTGSRPGIALHVYGELRVHHLQLRTAISHSFCYVDDRLREGQHNKLTFKSDRQTQFALNETVSFDQIPKFFGSCRPSCNTFEGLGRDFRNDMHRTVNTSFLKFALGSTASIRIPRIWPVKFKLW